VLLKIASVTRLALGATVAVLAIAALCVSLIGGAPRTLPGVAPGSLGMLHADAPLALVVVVIDGLTMLIQALPTSDRAVHVGVRYEADAAGVPTGRSPRDTAGTRYCRPATKSGLFAGIPHGPARTRTWI
jgi:hypothetical protein